MEGYQSPCSLPPTAVDLLASNGPTTAPLKRNNCQDVRKLASTPGPCPYIELLRSGVTTSIASISKCQYYWGEGGEEGEVGQDMHTCDTRPANASKSIMINISNTIFHPSVQYLYRPKIPPEEGDCGLDSLVGFSTPNPEPKV